MQVNWFEKLNEACKAELENQQRKQHEPRVHQVRRNRPLRGGEIEIDPLKLRQLLIKNRYYICSDFAEAADLYQGHFSQIYNGKIRRIRAETFSRICKQLNIEDNPRALMTGMTDQELSNKFRSHLPVSRKIEIITHM